MKIGSQAEKMLPNLVSPFMKKTAVGVCLSTNIRHQRIHLAESCSKHTNHEKTSPKACISLDSDSQSRRKQSFASGAAHTQLV